MSSRYDFPGGGGGGAPVNAQYLVLALDAALTDERVFSPAARLVATDNGAGGTYVLDLASLVGVAGSYTYASVTVDSYGRVTAASSGASPTVATGWTDGGGVVYLTTAADDVSIGSNTPVANRKLSVYNGGTDLGVSVVTLASTDTVIESFVTGEANLRWAVDGTGATRWGAGGASALDTRLYRSASKTLTVDDGAAGPAALTVLGTTTTQQRVHAFASKTSADTGYVVASTDDTLFWDCSGGNCTTTIPTPVGAGGREIVFKRTDTSVNTLTLTPAAGQVEGAASYIVPGGPGRAAITLRSDNSNWWVI